MVRRIRGRGSVYIRPPARLRERLPPPSLPSNHRICGTPQIPNPGRGWMGGGAADAARTGEGRRGRAEVAELLGTPSSPRRPAASLCGGAGDRPRDRVVYALLQSLNVVIGAVCGRGLLGRGAATLPRAEPPRRRRSLCRWSMVRRIRGRGSVYIRPPARLRERLPPPSLPSNHRICGTPQIPNPGRGWMGGGAADAARTGEGRRGRAEVAELLGTPSSPRRPAASLCGGAGDRPRDRVVYALLQSLNVVIGAVCGRGLLGRGAATLPRSP